jgi:dCTP deaminase
VLVRPGSLLTQIRFRRGQPETTDADLANLHREQGLISSKTADIAGGIALSVDLSGESDEGIIGYRAKRHTGVIDVDRAGGNTIADFWEPIRANQDRYLILDPDQFYILASKEAIHIPPTHAAEMVPFNPLVGEFRVHYAGFLDPGFGHAAAAGSGSRVVLEVRSHKVPFFLEDGQIVGRVMYEQLTRVPDTLYGMGIGSHYQAQGLKLSKHFQNA